MHRKSRMANGFIYAFLSLGALMILFPLYITIATSLKSPAESAIRRAKPTFGQSLMEKVKKFFEEVE